MENPKCNMFTKYLVSKKYIYISSFEIESGKIVFSDTGYEFDEDKYKHGKWNPNYLVSNAMAGKWYSWIHQHNYKKGGKRNAILYALNSSIIDKQDMPDKIDKKKWK